MSQWIRRVLAAAVGGLGLTALALVLVAVAEPSAAQAPTTTVGSPTTAQGATTTAGERAAPTTTQAATSTTRVASSKRTTAPSTVVKRPATTLRRSTSTITAPPTSEATTTSARKSQVSTTLQTTTVPSVAGLGSAPPIEPNATLPSDPAQVTLRWTIAGLLVLAAIIFVVSVLFWRATRPIRGPGAEPLSTSGPAPLGGNTPGAVTDASGNAPGWGTSSNSGPLIGPPRIPASEILARPPGQQWPSNPGGPAR